uniref:BSD domain-containing protein n=1 Tax=Caenorhabditis japonica TaxID=281687 RepID=A0A8R1DMA9_CAEJA
MSWLLADMKKKMNEAKSTLEQSFKQVAELTENDQQEEHKKAEEQPEEQKEENKETILEESATETAKKSMVALFGGLRSGSEVASTKLFEYAKDAGKRLGEVKNAVIENTILGDMNKDQDEHEKQLEDERAKLKNIDMPWQGLPDEVLAKKHMLSLSTDTRNFLRDSAASSEYTYQQQQAMAEKLLKEDANLANVRFQLVPKQVKEDQFWQNYFYRIGLIRQSMIAQGAERTTTPTMSSTSEEKPKEEEPTTTSTSEVCQEKVSEPEEFEEKEKELELDVTQEESEEEAEEPVFEQPAAPGEQTLTSVDEEWEREILADLNDYDDVVGKTGGKDDDAWEAEIQELLNAE